MKIMALLVLAASEVMYHEHESMRSLIEERSYG